MVLEEQLHSMHSMGSSRPKPYMGVRYWSCLGRCDRQLPSGDCAADAAVAGLRVEPVMCAVPTIQLDGGASHAGTCAATNSTWNAERGSACQGTLLHQGLAVS